MRNTGWEAITSAKFWIGVDDEERLVESTVDAVRFRRLYGTPGCVCVTTTDPTTHRFVGG